MSKRSIGAPEDTTLRPTTAEEKRARLRELPKLTTREMLLRIMQLIGDDDVSDEELLRALIILEGVEPTENQAT